MFVYKKYFYGSQAVFLPTFDMLGIPEYFLSMGVWQNVHTGGPPLARKSLTRFPLTRFLAYVRVSGGISVSRGPQYSPTNTSFM